MSALISGIDNYNYEKAIVVGEPLHPDLRIETDSFEKAMVVDVGYSKGFAHPLPPNKGAEGLHHFNCRLVCGP